MHTYKIAAVGGDGIGPEVVEAGVQVLKVCAERDGGFTLDIQDFKWGSDYYRTDGRRRPAPQVRRHPVRRRRGAGHPGSHHPMGPALGHLPVARPSWSPPLRRCEAPPTP